MPIWLQTLINFTDLVPAKTNRCNIGVFRFQRPPAKRMFHGGHWNNLVTSRYLTCIALHQPLQSQIYAVWLPLERQGILWFVASSKNRMNGSWKMPAGLAPLISMETTHQPPDRVLSATQQGVVYTGVERSPQGCRAWSTRVLRGLYMGVERGLHGC